MSKKLNIVAVGTGDWHKPALYVGYVKTFLEKTPGIKGRTEMTIVCPDFNGSFKGLLPKIKPLSPDMVTVTPHEDWDNASMFELCHKLKNWNPDLVIVVYAESPRNRIQVEDVRKSGVIDYIIHGEAEIPFTALVKYLLDGGNAQFNFPNIICFKREAALSKTKS
ncbi:MAG TPA: hypothetical protein DCL44_02910 [Elusimicrobia bacterium]|nr:hypothetical protein [Elusimicrobiota bacterium]